MKQRFDKLVGMGPQVMHSPTKEKKLVHDLNHTGLRECLSPMSASKVHQLDFPSKKGLTEYDRGMVAVEGSLKKAIKSCNTIVDKVKEAEEKERARLERLQKEQEKIANKRLKMLEKARTDGSDMAGQELALVQTGKGTEAQEDDENDEDDDDDEECTWQLVLQASEMLKCPSKNLGGDPRI